MNADRLLRHYEQIADAPDAIARLRRFILDLAVRGKLVPQDANDEPASDLLKRIAKEKARLVKAGEIRKPPTLEPITDAEVPYDLPRIWAWVRVGDIFDYDAGTKRDPKELDQSRWLLELEDIEKDTSRIVERLIVSDRDSLSTKSEFEPGDILYGKLRPYLNKVVVADERGYSTTEIVAIRPFLQLSPDYCALAFRRPDFVAYVERLGRGTKMPRLRTPDAIVAPFPLPPLAEQHRIVAKVDELMGLCDRLEAARASREGARDRLAAASLARLNAPDPETFQDDARFALDALPALTTRPDQIKRLRQTILNLAVRGKLVPQDANDEPASELLARFANARAKERKGRDWSKSGGGKHEQSFDPPLGWSWTTIDETAQRVTVGYVGPMKDQYVDAGIPFLRSQNVRANSFRRNGLIFITPEFHRKIIKSALTPGDVVVVRSGNVGTACAIPADLPIANCSDLVVIQQPECIVPEFLCFYLNSLASVHVEAGTVGVALTHFNTKSVANMPIPLPPLAEQHRIVAKVDALMSLCDRLEASLTATAATRRRLLDALLAEALAPVDAHELETAE